MDARATAEAEARVRADEASQARSQASLNRAKEAHELAKSEYQRAESLIQRGAITQAEFDRHQQQERIAEADARAAEFAKKVADFELELARAALIRTRGSAEPGAESMMTILAPVSGRVLRVFQESAGVVTPSTKLIEVGDPLDFQLQAALAEYYPGPMATGENLFSHQDARNLIRYGGMRPDRDWLQFDCALSYGLCEYLRTLDVLKTHGWSPSRCIPHGGHQMSLNIAAGLGLGGNESYPDLFQPYGGFPDGVRVENGHITMPDLPGIGFEGKSDLYREMKALAD